MKMANELFFHSNEKSVLSYLLLKTLFHSYLKQTTPSVAS